MALHLVFSVGGDPDSQDRIESILRASYHSAPELYEVTLAYSADRGWRVVSAVKRTFAGAA